MKHSAILQRARIYSSALFVFLAIALAAPAPFARAEAEAAKAETLRPEVAKPLQAAQDLLKEKKFKEALAKVAEADAVAEKTPYEAFVIERVRGAAAASAGDIETAVKAFEAVIAAGRLPAADQLKLIEAVAGTYYQAKQYAKVLPWAQRYLKEGGTNVQVRMMLAQVQYLAGDFTAAAKALEIELGADEAAGTVPSEERLQLLANCYVKLKDFDAYAKVLERLVTYHPKKEYWGDLITRVQRKAGFANRLWLDAYRLQYATGNLNEATDYLDMAQLAIQAGLPAEAQRILDEGFAKNVLGTGKEAERQKKLREQVTKQAADDLKGLPKFAVDAEKAKDGSPLVSVGYAYTSVGQIDKGVALMERGIAKGGLKRPEEAKLHLGLAILQLGDKARAGTILKEVQGSDGEADLARLWRIQAKL